MNRWIDVVLALLVAALVSVPMRAVDSLSVARDLYAAAEYEGALELLNSLQPGAHEPEERRAIEQYRAYCLLALGRSADAEKAIAAAVTATPLYKPTGADASPSMRLAFSDVRRRMLPSIIQEKYAAAKTAYERKNFALAATVFGEVVDAMADPDLADAVSRPPLADLRVLAAGFRDLSASSALPPPLAASAPVLTSPVEIPPSGAAPAARVAPPVARAAAPVATKVADPVVTKVAAPVVTRVAAPDAKIYAGNDVNVLPPAAVHQTLPPFPAQFVVARRGVLEIVIDEEGKVENALMRESINPRYDVQVIAAARGWQYKPATLDGVPVKYRKMMQVDVKR
jgi:hypothetical protein